LNIENIDKIQDRPSSLPSASTFSCGPIPKKLGSSKRRCREDVIVQDPPKKSKEEIAESSLAIEKEKATAKIVAYNEIAKASESVTLLFQVAEFKTRLEITKIMKEMPESKITVLLLTVKIVKKNYNSDMHERTKKFLDGWCVQPDQENRVGLSAPMCISVMMTVFKICFL
jgi:hypothetical protein